MKYRLTEYFTSNKVEVFRIKYFFKWSFSKTRSIAKSFKLRKLRIFSISNDVWIIYIFHDGFPKTSDLSVPKFFPPHIFIIVNFFSKSFFFVFRGKKSVYRKICWQSYFKKSFKENIKMKILIFWITKFTKISCIFLKPYT